MMKNKVKNIVNELSIISMVLGLIVGVAFFNSCEEENDAPPKITRVRAIEPEEAEIDLDGAGLNDWIVIQGENLATTQHVYFNNYEAGFNPAFVTETNIVLQIPAETPNIGTNPDAPNTVVVVTEFGEARHDFITFAPPPEISRMSNEFALPGDTLSFSGQYFYFVDSVVFPGNVIATEFWDSEDGKTMRVIVPEGATNPGPIKVVTKGGAGGSMRWTYFKDTISTVKCNFDDVMTFIWGCDIITDDGNFPGASGSFANITASGIVEENAGWWDPGRSCNLDSIRWVSVSELENSASDYIFKCEMFVAEPWKTGTIVVDFTGSWSYQGRIAPWIQDGERVTYSSGKWETVYIPLSEFKTQRGTAEAAASLGQLFYSNGFSRLGLMHINNGDPVSDIPALFLESFSIGIDNIRIVKKTE